jgi:hypothetical protein
MTLDAPIVNEPFSLQRRNPKGNTKPLKAGVSPTKPTR